MNVISMRIKCLVGCIPSASAKLSYRNMTGRVVPLSFCTIEGGNMTSAAGKGDSTQGLQLDCVRHKVQIDGKILPKPLSPKAFRLLEFLVTHAGKVCPREETSQAVYNERYVPRRDNARLDALVERTRARIGDDQRNPRFIETVRGIGHRLKEYAQETQQATTDAHSLQPCGAGAIHE